MVVFEEVFERVFFLGFNSKDCVLAFALCAGVKNYSCVFSFSCQKFKGRLALLAFWGHFDSVFSDFYSDKFDVLVVCMFNVFFVVICYGCCSLIDWSLHLQIKFLISTK